MDIRAILINYPGTNYALNVELEVAETNMTIGNRYMVLGLIVDNAATPLPKPYAITFDDGDHFKIVDLAKVKRASAP